MPKLDTEPETGALPPADTAQMGSADETDFGGPKLKIGAVATFSFEASVVTSLEGFNV